MTATDAPFALQLTRDGLEATLMEPIRHVVETVRATLAAANLTPDQITAVFLTGGSTAIPLARRSITAIMPNAAVVQGDAFGSVGLGLGIEAARRFGG